MLRQRVVTALVLAAVLLASLLWLPAPALGALFAAVVLLASWEWSDLAGLRHPGWRGAYALAIAAILLGVALHTGLPHPAAPEPVREILGVAGIWWAVALLWVRGYPASALLWGSVPVRLLMGALVLVPAWTALVYLRSLPQGVTLILLLVALVAAADVGAYFAGRAWGRRKLAPRVSPGKSWAGFWGGAAAGVGLALVGWVALWREPAVLAPLLGIALATVLVSVLGDLVESMVKRHRGVKDSGHCLPGHGGVLDRLDSLSAAAPVFALGWLLVGWSL